MAICCICSLNNSIITIKNMKSPEKRSAKKQLELTITEKFMAVLTELGHDADKLKREVKKASKFVTKKIERKFKEVKQAVGDKLGSAPVTDAVKKSASTAKKDVVKKAAKVEKVIAKATKIAEKRIRKPVEKAVAKAEVAAADAKAAIKKTVAKSVVKVDAAIADTKAAVKAAPVKKAVAKAAATPKAPTKTTKK